MKWSECKILLRSDLNRLAKRRGGIIGYLFTNAPFRVIFWFRIGTYLKEKSGIFYRPLYLLVHLIQKHCQYQTGIQLPIGTEAGGGLFFPHFSCIVINSGIKIGNNCTILSGVTIGSIRGPKGGVPQIGNNVVLTSGVKVIGNVKIGDNSIIGAGAVVVNDIPENSVAVGVPAKVVSKNGYEKVKYYIPQ